jgi:hypothetical protein
VNAVSVFKPKHKTFSRETQHYSLVELLRRVIFDKTLQKYVPFDEWQQRESQKISYRRMLSAGLRRPMSEGNLYDLTYRRPRSEASGYDFSQ